MSQTYFLTLIIYILLIVISGGTWLILRSLNKSLRRISSDIQYTIDKLEAYKQLDADRGH